MFRELVAGTAKYRWEECWKGRTPGGNVCGEEPKEGETAARREEPPGGNAGREELPGRWNSL